MRIIGLGFDLFFELADVRRFGLSCTSALIQCMQGQCLFQRSYTKLNVNGYNSLLAECHSALPQSTQKRVTYKL
jgi:hypothetical protein